MLGLLPSSFIASILADLDCKWQAKGMGIKFGKWSSCTEAWNEWSKKHQSHSSPEIENQIICLLAFVDDLYIIANCLAEAQVMTNELILARICCDRYYKV